jgi:hypothetical protein
LLVVVANVAAAVIVTAVFLGNVSRVWLQVRTSLKDMVTPESRSLFVAL